MSGCGSIDKTKQKCRHKLNLRWFFVLFLSGVETGGGGGSGAVFVPVYIQYTYKPIAIAVFKMRGVGRVVINHLFYGVL